MAEMSAKSFRSALLEQELEKHPFEPVDHRRRLAVFCDSTTSGPASLALERSTTVAGKGL